MNTSRLASYKFFGIEFGVDRALTGLTAASTRGPYSVHVSLSQFAPRDLDTNSWEFLFRSDDCDRNGNPYVLIDQVPTSGLLRIRYADGVTFVLNQSGSQICAFWNPPSTLEDVATYLLGHVSGLLLYRRGLTSLHASAIALNGKALVFVGAAEAGKSTLAAAFARLGHRVLADDILVLDQAECLIVARPGIPRIGLWPQSVAHLWGDADALPRQTPTWEKRYLDLAAHGLFQDAPLPIAAVYVLGERASDLTLSIEPASGTEALLVLLANKYVTRYSEREQDKRDFVLLSKLAASVPIRRVTRSDTLSDLDATCEAIVADYDALALTLA